MNVRVQRLQRALISRTSLPLIFSRRITTDEPPSTLRHLPVQDGLRRRPRLLDEKAVQTANAAISKDRSAVPEPVSSVHWSLGEGYEVGRHMKRAAEQSKVDDEDGMPMFGEFGIPIKFSSLSRPTTTVV
jgi:hypothetical protein